MSSLNIWMFQLFEFHSQGKQEPMVHNVTIIAADDLLTLGARASVAMAFTLSSQIIPVHFQQG